MALDTLPLPPRDYMELVCGRSQADQFEMVGEALIRMLEAEDMLDTQTDLLDVGCGCGRVARYLVDRPLHSYTGFDRHPGMIEWCVGEIARRQPKFAFHHVDVRSAYVSLDGHAGTIAADAFHFPFPDAAFDSALLASVFTHMPLEETRHYLSELRRVLRPGGKALLSVFFAKRRPYLFLFSRAKPYFLSNANFFYNPQAFARCLRQSGFVFLARGTLVTGYSHNWYVLTKPGS